MRARGPSAALSKSHAQHSGDLGLLSLRQPPPAGLQVGWEGVWAPSAGQSGNCRQKRPGQGGLAGGHGEWDREGGLTPLSIFVVVVQSLSRVRLFVTPWTSLSFTIFRSLLKLVL